MSADPKPSTPLFVTDDELRNRLCPRIGKRRFRVALRTLELRKFPKLQPAFGGRYWPAVRAWLDAENGIGENPSEAGGDDGEEHWPNATSKR
jgi:hypothetical protein